MENHCEECGLHKLCKRPRIRGRGEVDHPRLIVIGEAPGPNEDEEGSVFIGKAGKLLSEVLGDQEDDVFITNAVKCCPYADPCNYDSGFRQPSNLEIEWCKPFLERELSLFDPKKTAIMTLGNVPLTSLLGKHKGITKEAGKVQYVKVAGKMWKIIPNYHPSYILRGKLGSSTDKEFRNIVRIALTHDKEEAEEDRIYRIADPARAIKEARLIKEAYLDKVIDYVVYDCETSGFLPWKHKMIMYSYYAPGVNTGIEDKATAVPIHIQNLMHHEDYPYQQKYYPIDWELSPRDIAKINHAVGDMIETVPIVGHNLKFDIHFAVAHNIAKMEHIKVFCDTLLLSHVIIGRQRFGALDLKTLCIKLFGCDNWEAPIDQYRIMFRKIEERSYDNIPTSILGEYAAKDTYYNNALFELLVKFRDQEESEESEEDHTHESTSTYDDGEDPVYNDEYEGLPDQVTTSRREDEI